jgi:hypothetical protein
MRRLSNYESDAAENGHSGAGPIDRVMPRNIEDGARAYPPAIAPTISSGSVPLATASGSGASGDS